MHGEEFMEWDQQDHFTKLGRETLQENPLKDRMLFTRSKVHRVICKDGQSLKHVISRSGLHLALLETD